MAITTFISPLQRLNWVSTSDEEINEWFNELKQKDCRYYIEEIIFIRKRWFRKSIVDKRYTLYFDYRYPETDWDIQIINFCIQGTMVNKDVITNYIMGLLTGVEECL